MAHAHIHDDLKRCINLQVPARVPCFPLGLEFDVRQAGVTHRQFRTDPERMIEVGRKTIARFDYDWFILFPDDLIEWEDTGIVTTDDETIPPAVRHYLPATEESLKGLRLPDPRRTGRLPLHLEALKGLKAELGDTVVIAGRIAAPFSGVALLLGVEATLLLMLENPALLRKFMDYVHACNEIVAPAQIEAGAEILWLGDCVATSRFISPDTYSDFALDYADQSAQSIRNAGGLTLYHGAETSLPHLTRMADVACDALNVGEGIDIGKVKQAIGHKKCVMGNLDPIRILRNGAPADVECAVADMLASAAPNGGYIFCTAEGIPHDTPATNVETMVNAVR